MAAAKLDLNLRNVTSVGQRIWASVIFDPPTAPRWRAGRSSFCGDLRDIGRYARWRDSPRGYGCGLAIAGRSGCAVAAALTLR
jgi:hypothetical protein